MLTSPVNEHGGRRRETEEEEAEESRPQPPWADEDKGSEAEALAKELAELDLRHQRAVADLDNYRKRSRREIERRSIEQREALLREWLEVLDSIERALTHVDDRNQLYGGLRAVLDQIEGVMRRQGVRRSGAVGDRFDPELHQAVGVHEREDLPSQTVVELVRAGYALGDRVLRPAEVIVAQPRKAVS